MEEHLKENDEFRKFFEARPSHIPTEGEYENEAHHIPIVQYASGHTDAGVAAALWNLKSQQDLVNDAQDEYNRKKEETIAKEEEHKRKIDELVRVAGDESLSTQTRSEAMVVLMQKYPALFKNYNTEIETNFCKAGVVCESEFLKSSRSPGTGTGSARSTMCS